jgi:hypothetical protein
MTTEALANLAREEWSDRLFAAGVHGLAVEQTKLNDVKAFAVIAMLEPGSKVVLPNSLSVLDGKSVVNVPVIIQRVAPFKPEI